MQPLAPYCQVWQYSGVKTCDYFKLRGPKCDGGEAVYRVTVRFVKGEPAAYDLCAACTLWAVADGADPRVSGIAIDKLSPSSPEQA